MVLFQALCLGLARIARSGCSPATRSRSGVFHQSTGYLAEAFTLGSNTVVGAPPAAARLARRECSPPCLASAVPLLDLRSGRARDAVYRQDGVPGNALRELGRSKAVRRFRRAACGGGGPVTRSRPRPRSARRAILALATVLAVPLVLRGVLALMRLASARFERLVTLPVALASLRANDAALAGARRDRRRRAVRQRRARRLARGPAAGHPRVRPQLCRRRADIWVTNPGDNQAVNEFAPGARRGSRSQRSRESRACAPFRAASCTLG